MFNFFKRREEEISPQELQQNERSIQMTDAVLRPSGTPIDEERAMEKRDILIQLSQWQQDRSPQMRSMFQKLAGLQYKKGSKDELEKVKWDIAYCTPQGAAKLVTYIEFLDHNVMLANWSEKRLLITMREGIAHPLNDYILYNHSELGLKLEHADYVFNMIVNAVEPNYWRGWNNGERNKDKEIIKVNEVRNFTEKQKKKTIFGTET